MLSIFKICNGNHTRENATNKEHPEMFITHPFFCMYIFKFEYFEEESNRIWLITPRKMMLRYPLAFDTIPNTQTV